MSAEIIDGKALAKSLQEKLSEEVAQIKTGLGRSPGLAVVLVGENPASKVYVKSKSVKARKCGIEVEDVVLPSDTSDRQLQDELRKLSQRSDIDGILLQLPLPDGLDEFAALQCIAPEKDADGLHPMNQGLLLRGADGFEPCTPKGSMLLIEQACQQLGRPSDLSGMNAVVLGRSILVGKPMALMLLDANCTVSVCHSRTKDLASFTRSADILVAAVGRENLVSAEHIKPGAIVIDVGINRNAEGKLVGDVDFDSVVEVAGALTPVPGGVGPMTITVLLQNTVKAASRKIK